MTSEALPLRPYRPEESSKVFELLRHAFLDPAAPREEDEAVFAAALEPERSLAAFDGDTPVASGAVLTMTLTVPGAVVPAGGVTIVSVHPTYRRRGLLSAIMTRQLTELAEGGEAVAALWASESKIYGRYGYAVATRRLRANLARADAALLPDAPDPSGLSLEVRPPHDVRAELATMYDRLLPSTPGLVSRNDGMWGDILHDPEHARNGATQERALLVRDGDELRGFAVYRHKEESGDTRVRVSEVQALDPAAYVACWRYLTDQDLTNGASTNNWSVDEPLLRMLVDPRRANTTIEDGLWVRLVRVGEALAQRRYAAPVDVVIDVVDSRCKWNAGRWRLVGDESGASCERTDDVADLTVDQRALAAAYLGDSQLSGWATAGMATEHTPGTLRRLSTAMSWDPRPWCANGF